MIHRVRSVAVAVAVVVLLVGCSDPVPGTAGASGKAAIPVVTTPPPGPWSAPEVGQKIATGRGPAFPAELDGWQLAQQWSEPLVRAFEGTWSGPSGPKGDGFPATMNGCDTHRFLIRWRSLTLPVITSAGYPTSVTEQILNSELGQTTAADRGWADLDGCQALFFQLPAAAEDGSTLTDVAMDVQEWSPTA